MNALRNALGRSSKSATPNENEEGAAESVRYSLEDFEVTTTLGTGTFGRVRLAKLLRENNLENPFFALKVLKKNIIIRQKQVAHIKSEVSLLGSIEHPFIVNMIAHFQDAQKLYMVLEYVPGGELFTHLRNEGRLPDNVAKFYAAQIVLAFGYLHSKLIAYRDLKPENLLITHKGNIKITDFGFAKVVEQRTWTLCGTPEYLAPEVVQGKGHGRPVDWWAFGVLVFEMLAGYPPFLHENHVGTYQKILNGFVEYPTNFDHKAVSLIKKLLTADLTKRLGCLKNGVADVRKAKWFQKVNWKAVHDCDPSIKIPYIPPLYSPDDTQNFDEYPESDEDEDLEVEEEDKKFFEDFDTLGQGKPVENVGKKAETENEPKVKKLDLT